MKKQEDRIEEELKKGCGKKEKVWKGYKNNYWDATCGKPILYELDSREGLLPLTKHYCSICKAKLQQLQEDKKIFEKIIENRLIVLRQHSDLENVKVVIRELEELKKELVGE